MNNEIPKEIIQKIKKYKNPMKAVREIREELQSILKEYHYESDTENMSKDVVVALENLVGNLKPSKLPKEILVRTWEVE